MGVFAHKWTPQPMNGVVPGVSGLVPPAAIALLCACLLTGCSGKPEAATVQPISRTASGLICTEPKWDLGEVLVKGDKVDFEHTFRLENRSQKTINLQEIRSDCGCLVAKGYAKTIEPGGETEIKVKIAVFGPPGRFRKTLEVKEESESNGTIPLFVTGSRAISDLLYGSPETIDFGTLTPNESKTKRLILCRYDGSAVNFRDLVAENHRLGLGGEPTRSTREDVMGKSVDCVELPIRLDLKSEAVGPFRSKVTIRTDSAGESTAKLNVDVKAMIVEEETPWVRSIFINRLEPGETVERPMTNQEKPADCPEITSTSYEGDDSIQVEVVHPSADGGSPPLPRVRISRRVDSPARGLARGTLSLRTGEMTTGAVTRIGITAFLPK